MKPTMTILSMRISKIIGLAALLTLTAYAGPITITYSSVGTGSVGATPFTNAPFTITELDDTANRQFQGGGVYLIDDSSASIAITGVGTFSFTTATRTFGVQGTPANPGFAGFGRGDRVLLFARSSPGAFSGWDITTSLGPFTAPGQIFNWSLIQTTGGTLVFNDASPIVTFQAVVGGSAVPEPASMALFGLGLAGLGLARYGRRLLFAFLTAL